MPLTYDVFFSICQTPVDGYKPSERVMFENFFDQVRLADELGYGCAWVAETHLSCQIQKENPGAVIPHFEGEIGLNTDLLQTATHIFYQTKRIKVGSAIRNILCNGGPIAHAESVKTFLTLNRLAHPDRTLELGFAAGRFPFSNKPYGILPRDPFEKVAWPALSGKIFLEATEIFLRFLKNDIFASADLKPHYLNENDFRSPQDWQNASTAYTETYGERVGEEGLRIRSRWNFEKVGVIPFETPLEKLKLTIGAHWAEAHRFANQFLPVGVFNLSITPTPQIEETHQRMLQCFHPQGGAWSRKFMPRTVLVFINDDEGVSVTERRLRAHTAAEKALANYWRALEGTLDPAKVQNAVGNALVGTPEDIKEQIEQRFDPEDRLMLWFDFNDHDNEAVKRSMRLFMGKVAHA